MVSLPRYFPTPIISRPRPPPFSFPLPCQGRASLLLPPLQRPPLRPFPPYPPPPPPSERYPGGGGGERAWMAESADVQRLLIAPASAGFSGEIGFPFFVPQGPGPGREGREGRWLEGTDAGAFRP